LSAHADASPSSAFAMALKHEGKDCLMWPFSVDSRGYPNIRRGGKTRMVSRLLCIVTRGPPPTPAHQAAHDCGKRLCINRHHLNWKTRIENAADRVQHGTTCRGERSPCAKLTYSQVQSIRSLAKSVQRVDIAKYFNIDPSTVGQIVSGRRWGHS